MFPESILPPTIPMVSREHDGGMGETLEQRADLLIHELHTEALAPPAVAPTLMGLKGNTGVVLPIPGCTLMPIGHMGFPHIQEHKQGLIRSQLQLKPGELPLEMPRGTSVKKMFKILRETRAGFGGGIKPTDRTTPKGPITQTAKSLHDGGTV